MNNQQRAELLAIIADLCRRYPDWRLGQLVANVAGWTDQDIWDVEDEQLLQAARLHLQQLAQREEQARA
jgi:HD superfamily phosphohydrolase YqeK